MVIDMRTDLADHFMMDEGDEIDFIQESSMNESKFEDYERVKDERIEKQEQLKEKFAQEKKEEQTEAV